MAPRISPPRIPHMPQVGMIWLDATDPGPNDPGYDPTKPWGNPRGTCNQTSGNYTKVEKYEGDSYPRIIPGP